MTALIDHLVYAAPDLAAAIGDLERRFGVRAHPGGKHVGLGTHNALAALGPATYLEIIAPDPEEAPPPRARPFGLDSVTAGGIAGWAITCDDIDAAIARARSLGYDPGDAIDMQRVGPTGTVLHWRLTLNALKGGPVPFLIAWGDTDHPARSAPTGLVLESLAIEDPDSDSLTSVLTALDVDIEIRPATHTALVAHIRGPKGIKELR